MTWLVDFDGSHLGHDLPMRVRMQAISLLQTHYPERLGLLLGYHTPRLFSMTYRVCFTFVVSVKAEIGALESLL